MSKIPAICDTPDCVDVFESSIELKKSRNICFRNNQAKCPHCGQYGRIPDGIFSNLQDALIANLANVKDVKTLANINNLIVTAFKNNNFEDLKDDIKSESPELTAIVDAISEGQKEKKWCFWVLFCIINSVCAISHLVEFSSNLKNLISQNREVINNNITYNINNYDFMLPSPDHEEPTQDHHKPQIPETPGESPGSLSGNLSDNQEGKKNQTQKDSLIQE